MTATTSSPASSASWAAAALSTPPLIATSVRRGLALSSGVPALATAPSAPWSASAASSATCRLGGTSPPRAASTSSGPTRVQEGATLDELDHGAAGGGQRAAALGVEARLRDPVPLDAHAHAYEVAAGGTARETGIRSVGKNASAGRGIEMLGKGAHDGTYAIAASCSESPTLLNRAKTKQPKEEASG